MKKKQRQGKLKINFLVRLVIFISPLGLYSLLARLEYIPSLFELPKILCLNNCPKQKQLHIAIANKQLLNYERQIKDIITTIDKSQTSILIEKSKYKLTLYHQGTPIKSYPVVFGANPVGDKLKEGDKRTPEGIFQIRDLYPHKSWSKFIWLDYPTKDSWRKHLQAKRERKIHWFDSIGSEIGIHGVPKGEDYLIDAQWNWTWGCISLKTQDIDELYQVVQTGTKVEIIP